MPIKWIIGQAGTGKTTSTLNAVSKMKDIIFLGYTHTAVNNLKEKDHDNHPPSSFMTIHKKLQLPLDDYVFHKNIKFPSIVIIDEFSLIPIKLMELLFTYAKKYNNSTFIFIGDMLQLPAINPESPPLCDMTLPSLAITLKQAYYIISFINSSVYRFDEYQKGEKKILKTNYRSTTDVLKLLDTRDIIITPVNEIDSFDIVLSARYKYLKMMYKTTGYKVQTRIGWSGDDKYVLTENIDEEHLNGDVVDISYVREKDLFPKQVMPLNYSSVHKAQGKGWDDVVVILDGMDSVMLYTAITRAKKRVRFVAFNDYTIDWTLFDVIKQLVYK